MLVDTNVLVRHLTGDPPEQAERAGRLIETAEELLLCDVVLAECFHVLRSVYRRPCEEVAATLRAVVRSRQVRVLHPALAERALELSAEGAGFVDAYLVALGELAEVGPIASFDRGLEQLGEARRVEPG